MDELLHAVRQRKIKSCDDFGLNDPLLHVQNGVLHAGTVPRSCKRELALFTMLLEKNGSDPSNRFPTNCKTFGSPVERFILRTHPVGSCMVFALTDA